MEFSIYSKADFLLEKTREGDIYHLTWFSQSGIFIFLDTAKLTKFASLTTQLFDMFSVISVLNCM